MQLKLIKTKNLVAVETFLILYLNFLLLSILFYNSSANSWLVEFSVFIVIHHNRYHAVHDDLI